MAGLLLDQDFEPGVVDLALGIHDLAQFLWIDLGAVPVRQVDGAGGEVDAEGNQAGDHVEQDADGIQRRHHRVDPAVDLAAPIGEEQGAAGAQLGEQGNGENAADNAGLRAHRAPPGKSWRNYSKPAVAKLLRIDMTELRPAEQGGGSPL
ncbi:hypothetical protein D9M69_595440 [compost metagenome]